ncbi:LptF/LptG family permease [Candidatus Dependentiae bacterium]|nr:LptF/LptG family permease [Candidatus Dependentiae bacterium]
MVLARYILQRFFTNLFFINISLTVLFNLVEFFEKMVRVKQTSTEAIFVFIALNLIPSFFENLPVASWLASCMTIKEMYQQNEWETLSLLNVPLKKVFSLIAIAGLVLMACSFLGKEFLSYRFAQTAEQFKQEQFKQNHHTKLFNRWLVLTKSNNKKNFCHFDYLDLTTKRGLRFTLFEISDQFSLQKTTCAKTFSIDPPTKKITLSNSTTLETSSRKILSPETKQLVLPSFFTQLTIQDKTPPITQIVRLLLFSKKVLPDYVYHQLLYLFLNRILIHLLLLLYPLLTFMLFFLFPHHRYTRWTLIMTPYPLAVLIFTATDSLMQTIHYGALAIIPYVILSLVALGAYKNIP